MFIDNPTTLNYVTTLPLIIPPRLIMLLHYLVKYQKKIAMLKT